jgi:uncharacterized membrane protein YedE/YeeE
VIVAYQSLTGGILIGCSATLLLAGNGRIAGISGILNGIFPNSTDETTWRLLFLAGLCGAAAVAFHYFPGSRPHRSAFPPGPLILAGLLVGVGTRMGNGCTSGHGVCGLGRLSLRSLIAVLVFITTAMITVLITRHLSTFSP